MTFGTIFQKTDKQDTIFRNVDCLAEVCQKMYVWMWEKVRIQCAGFFFFMGENHISWWGEVKTEGVCEIYASWVEEDLSTHIARGQAG